MKDIQTDILIIGGGLTGLMLGYLLKKENRSFQIVEARDRIGGRIWTKYKDNDPTAPLEMGATWLGRKHIYLRNILQQLGIGTFEQILGKTAVYEPISTSPPQLVSLPPNNDPSFRIKGGTGKLIEALAQTIDANQIHRGQVIQSIVQKADAFTANSATHQFRAKFIVSTLPPFLLTQTIDIQPSLPTNLVQTTQQTHTWMGESIKVGLRYAKPFWRTKNTSGTIFSSVGPIPEMYDHSNFEEAHFALKGFLNGAYFSVTKEERLALILKQLSRYYGEAANDYLSYEETVWRNEPFTFAPYPNHVLPHQNNGNPIFRKPYLDGHFFIAGAETAASHPGYMDGAIQSAQFVHQQLKSVLA